MKRIESRDNAAFKGFKKLCQSARERRKTGRIVLEGMHLIESFAARFGLPDEVVVSQTGLQTNEIARYLDQVAGQASAVLLADGLFAELSELDHPSGIIAFAAWPAVAKPVDDCCDTVVLDGVQDPGNLGSILRSAAAAGFKQAVLSDDCAQAWSPKVLRAGMGAHFLIDIFESVDLAPFLDRFQGQSIVTALDGKRSLFEVPLREPVAWVFGSEGQGVRLEVAACVRERVLIPMPGQTESLNVGAAAAVCLFETVRQRLPEKSRD